MKSVVRTESYLPKKTSTENWDYTDEFKIELNKRYNYYINGGKMISAEDAAKQNRKVVNEHQTK